MISELGYLHWRLFAVVVAAVVDMALLGVCTAYIWHEWRKPGFIDRFGNQLAIGITMHMLGLTIQRVWGAFLLAFYAYGIDIAPLDNAYPLTFAAGLLSAAGVLWKVRVLTPYIMVPWLWRVALLAALASGLLSVLAVP